MDYLNMVLFFMAIWLGSLAVLPAVLGYLLDRWLGDPVRWHPIVGMGRLISWGERRLNRGNHLRLKGAVYNGALIVLMGVLGLLMILACYYLSILASSYVPIDTFGFIFLGSAAAVSGLTFFYMISGTTLVREVREVFRATDRSLEAGRAQVARIVGRDTASLSEQDVRLAALETLSENLSDGVVAPMLAWGLGGVPGMLMYKMINTQDSMVGYLNDRYRVYGWFSAKVDDVANFVPARLTALLMLLSAWRLDLLPFVYKYGRCHLSPNSGYPEAALAGILGCRFGGPHDYFGVEVYKPYIGETDRPITSEDMMRAVHINRRVEWLALAIAIGLRLVFWGVVAGLLAYSL